MKSNGQDSKGGTLCGSPGREVVRVGIGGRGMRIIWLGESVTSSVKEKNREE